MKSNRLAKAEVGWSSVKGSQAKTVTIRTRNYSTTVWWKEWICTVITLQDSQNFGLTGAVVCCSVKWFGSLGDRPLLQGRPFAGGRFLHGPHMVPCSSMGAEMEVPLCWEPSVVKFYPVSVSMFWLLSRRYLLNCLTFRNQTWYCEQCEKNKVAVFKATVRAYNQNMTFLTISSELLIF